MQQLGNGKFFGRTNELFQLECCTITNTEYTIEKVDWHYHENAYFTFILEGKLLEYSKKDVYHCTTGSLLFHNWQDPHYNIKPPGYTRGFQLELKNNWFQENDISSLMPEGSSYIAHPDTKILFHHIFRETKLMSADSELSIQQLLLQMFSGMPGASPVHRNPGWVSKLRDLLHDQYADKLSLKQLASATGIHPVHLCRDFSKYFHCSLGDYTRKLRIERALNLMRQPGRSLTDIALECGFADQSHFLRSFKMINHIKPSKFRLPIMR
jgi:AraC family transcriptional regulator